MSGGTEPRTVLVDASVLINLASLRRLTLFGALEERFVVPETVIGEVRRDAQRSRLKRALQKGFLERTDPEDSTSAFLFSRLRQQGLGAGEAACLALAETCGWVIASDDRRAQREASARSVEYVDTPGLLLLAIRRDVLTLKEADAAIPVLEEQRFRVAFDSFAELL